MRISSFGKLSAIHTKVNFLFDKITVPSIVRNLHNNQNNKGLAYGQGKSYGDCCLNSQGLLWNTRGLNKFISFNPDTGVIVCEAGILLKEIDDLILNYGWQLPVMPGTQFITLGGAIANDVHGKNQHLKGTFGNHVLKLKLVRTDGKIIECGPKKLANWFYATVGGVGLTGVILEAEIQLCKNISQWLNVEKIPYKGIEEFINLAFESQKSWEYIVSWLDCDSSVSRGIFMRANYLINENYLSVKSLKSFPIPSLPIKLINRITTPIFNELYFYSQSILFRNTVVCSKSFLYPLDKILGWQHLYGSCGFFQYQCVIPFENALWVIKTMLKQIKKAKENSFLGTLKIFGNIKPYGVFSFARPGVNFSIDFHNNGRKTLFLLKELDVILQDSLGAIYLAKDAHMCKSLFEVSYADYNILQRHRDPGITSNLARRLLEN